MQTFKFPIKNKQTILALGAESAGNFSVYKNGMIYYFPDFGDLIEKNNFDLFKKSVLSFLKKENIRPDIILTDLHPLLKTTLWGRELSKKYKARHIQIQHHQAHIFSAIGEKILQTDNRELRTVYENVPVIAEKFYGVAMDGTGYGEDEKIWGGECFAISNFQFPRLPETGTGGQAISNQIQNSNDKNLEQRIHIEHIGKLENQTMIGGELAIREPARMLISILSKFLSKKEIYNFVKKYYTKNEFEILYNQLIQNFNCLETSSTGRIFDAVSVLLGFCNNERKYKHAPIDLLEKNSSNPYLNLKIIFIEPKKRNDSLENSSLKINSKFNPPAGGQNSKFVLQTTPLFEYLIKNLHKDKRRLAATAQLYLAQGLFEIISQNPDFEKTKQFFISGGLTQNKIISNFLKSQGAYKNKIIPCGDNGLSFGQIIYYLFK